MLGSLRISRSFVRNVVSIRIVRFFRSIINRKSVCLSPHRNSTLRKSCRAILLIEIPALGIASSVSQPMVITSSRNLSLYLLFCKSICRTQTQCKDKRCFHHIYKCIVDGVTLEDFGTRVRGGSMLSMLDFRFGICCSSCDLFPTTAPPHF